MQTNAKFYGIKKNAEMSALEVRTRASGLPLGATRLALPGTRTRETESASAPAVEGARPPAPPGGRGTTGAHRAPHDAAPPPLASMLLSTSRWPLGHKGIVQIKLKAEAAGRPGFARPGPHAWAAARFAPRPADGSPPGPPPTLVDAPRPVLPTSLLRLLYERGDVPAAVTQKGSGYALKWRVPLASLDYAIMLPALVSGLREMEWPLPFIAEQGVKDLVAADPARVLPVVPLCVPGLREAMATRRTPCVVRALMATETIAEAGAGPGGSPHARALVPFFRQLLPVANLFAGKNINIGDRPDYGQRKNRIIGERVDVLLGKLEDLGGPGALREIVKMVPTYTSRRLVE